jgi:hypothetical protein
VVSQLQIEASAESGKSLCSLIREDGPIANEYARRSADAEVLNDENSRAAPTRPISAEERRT